MRRDAAESNRKSPAHQGVGIIPFILAEVRSRIQYQSFKSWGSPGFRIITILLDVRN
jgi:hypothetical protein